MQGLDVNPMSAWIVREEIEHIDLPAYERAARALVASLRDDVGRYYRTTCPLYGDTDLPVKSFLWVKVLDCGHCGKPFDLFSGYLLAENRRHPKNVLVCPACGDLNEVEDRKSPGSCTICGTMLRQAGPARRGRCDCPHCGRSNVYPGEVRRPFEHRLFAIEYHNPRRKASLRGTLLVWIAMPKSVAHRRRHPHRLVAQPSGVGVRDQPVSRFDDCSLREIRGGSPQPISMIRRWGLDRSSGGRRRRIRRSSVARHPERARARENR